MDEPNLWLVVYFLSHSLGSWIIGYKGKKYFKCQKDIQKSFMAHRMVYKPQKWFVDLCADLIEN